jgi:hypothetical protein
VTTTTLGLAFVTLALSCAAAPSGPGAEAPESAPETVSAAPQPCSADPTPYHPAPANELQVELPNVPELPDRPQRAGEAYTVWGAGYALRTHVRRGEQKGLAITGYIVKTNLPDAPRCAVHKGGVADARGCQAPVPAFWLGDTPDAALDDCIKVMGFASSYAEIFEAIQHFDSKASGDYEDAASSRILPNPLPAVGAKVTITGTYDRVFAWPNGAEADPFMGILAYGFQKVLTPAPKLATLPGVRRK